MEGNKVRLGKLLLKDSTRLAELANNIKVWENLRDIFPHPYTIKDAESYIQMTSSEEPQNTFSILLDNELVGVVGVFVKTDVHRKTGEIGYWLGEDYWNKGIGTTAVNLIVDYAFEKLKLIRVEAGIFETNLASSKVLLKCGFEFEGVFRKSVIKNNKILNELRYGNINALKDV